MVGEGGVSGGVSRGEVAKDTAQLMLESTATHVGRIATIISEGGSGGALALGVANRVHVLEYGTYSVISPEGCASILWKDGDPDTEGDLDIGAPQRLPHRGIDLLDS